MIKERLIKVWYTKRKQSTCLLERVLQVTNLLDVHATAQKMYGYMEEFRNLKRKQRILKFCIKNSNCMSQIWRSQATLRAQHSYYISLITFNFMKQILWFGRQFQWRIKAETKKIDWKMSVLDNRPINMV